MINAVAATDSMTVLAVPTGENVIDRQADPDKYIGLGTSR